ncbi:hypothetical protein GOP47_0016470, partial [Adiantum capillus-veneris]
LAYINQHWNLETGAMTSWEWKQAMGQTLQKLVNDMGISMPVGTIAALLITSFVLALFARFSFKKRKSDTILLAGLSGSGKTALFYQQGKANGASFLDFPGHMRLRAKLDEYLKEAGAILFLVDAADFMPNVRENAEYLYDILSKAWVVKYKIPVLIIANKVDKVTAHSTEFIRKQLEKEIDKLRITRTAVSDADMTSEVSIGKEGEPFKFTHCMNKVTISEASVITGQVTSICQFIREHVGYQI